MAPARQLATRIRTLGLIAIGLAADDRRRGRRRGHVGRLGRAVRGPSSPHRHRRHHHKLVHRRRHHKEHAGSPAPPTTPTPAPVASQTLSPAPVASRPTRPRTTRSPVTSSTPSFRLGRRRRTSAAGTGPNRHPTPATGTRSRADWRPAFRGRHLVQRRVGSRRSIVQSGGRQDRR
jgi:hypothetical protein